MVERMAERGIKQIETPHQMVGQTTVQAKVAELERRIVELENKLKGHPAGKLTDSQSSLLAMWKEFWRGGSNG